MANRKGTNNDLQNTTQKTKDWSTWTNKKTVGELMSSRIPAPLVASVMLLSSDLVISQEWGKGGTVITTNETYPLSFLWHSFVLTFN
jgi:hypothetical protein